MSVMICKDCGTTGEPSRITKGSTWIELILWLCLIVPGLIYSFWRLSTRHDGCPSCSSISLVPLDSPVGKRLAQDYPPPALDVVARTSNAGAVGAALGRAFRKTVLRR